MADSNEAAERLHPDKIAAAVADMRKVLPSVVEVIEAAERMATVERIAKAIDKAAYKLDNRRYGPRILEVGEIGKILDAEAAR